MRFSDRRSRYLIANFMEEPQPSSPPSPRSDPEACIIPPDADDSMSDGTSTPSSSHFVDNLQWDEDEAITPTHNLNSLDWNAPVTVPTRPLVPYAPQERTPLIRKANSFHIHTNKHKGYDSIEGKKRSKKIRTAPPRKILPLEPIQKIQETSFPVKQRPLGRSTFGQTVRVNRASL